MGKQFYRQKVGIPQGSVLSTVLCNIFYADLEKKKLPFLLEEDGLLLRLIDDFLFITMNREHAQSFLEHMHKGVISEDGLIAGFPEYGCSVNMTKSLVNFDVTINTTKTPRLQGSKYFPFCGAMINVETLDVIKDYTRMEKTSIHHSDVSDIRCIGFIDGGENSDSWQSFDYQNTQVFDLHGLTDVAH
jgi:telomerase reverse transcriptase